MIEKIRRNFLDEDYCFDIILKSKNKLQPAQLTNGKLDQNFRNASRCSYYDSTLREILFKISDLNQLEGIKNYAHFQFSEYRQGQFFKWHNDGQNIKSHIILLNDDFTGGELEFENSGNLNLRTGDCVSYNSFIDNQRVGMHRVKKVTSGVRYSIVAWEFEKEIWENDYRFTKDIY